MKYFSFILIAGGMFLITNLFAAITKPVIIVKTNKDETTTGDQVTLVIEVNGTGVKHVSWNLCDTALANIHHINVLQGSSSAIADSVFKHVIVFTSTQPGSIIIDQLPVVASFATRDYKLLTGKVIVNFKNRPLLSHINDINTNVATRFLELKYVLCGALVIMIIIIVFAARSTSTKKKKLN